MTAVKLDGGIPLELETSLDAQQVSAQWYITTKLETLRPTFDMDQPLAPLTVDSDNKSWTQQYDNGLTSFSSAATSAFEIHGPIFDRYTAVQQSAPGILSFLFSDVEPTLGLTGVAATFSQGAIYHSTEISGRFGAIEVVGRIYLDYAIAGGPRVTGLLLLVPIAIDGGIFADNGENKLALQGWRTDGTFRPRRYPRRISHRRRMDDVGFPHQR